MKFTLPFLSSRFPTWPKIKITFSFPEFVSTHQKHVYSINFILRYNQFYSFVIRVFWSEWWHSFITTPIPMFFNQLLISKNFYQHAKNQAFSSFCSRDWFETPAIWLAKSILAHIWKARFFPNMRFVQAYSN